MNNVYNILVNGETGVLTKSDAYSHVLQTKPKKLIEDLKNVDKALLQISSQITFESMKLNKIIIEENKPKTIKKLKSFYDFKVYQLPAYFAPFKNDPTKNSLLITFFDGEYNFVTFKFSPIKNWESFTTTIDVINIEKWQGLNFKELRPHRSDKIYSIPTRKDLKTVLETHMDSLVFFVKTYKETRSNSKSLIGFFKTFNGYMNMCGLEKIIQEYLFNINNENHDNKKDNA